MLDNKVLSEREREILRLVATGASNKEIAQRLCISANTVKVHLRNIFSKTGVISRTEATLYAIREGLVQVQGQAVAQPDTAALPDAIPAATTLPSPVAFPRLSSRSLVSAFLVLAVLVASLVALMQVLYKPAVVASASPVPPTAAPRWQVKAPLNAARRSLAAAYYENQIVAIGGETERGITQAVEKYSVGDNTWTAVADKPTAVADINAAVVGGKIYVPGGRTSSGKPTDVLEVYDPRENAWQGRASLPVAISAYAMVAMEGKLYLFGGWDGEKALASVYRYDPSQDTWSARTPMPTARAFAGAASFGSRIYVMGGYDGEHPLDVNEEYIPERDNQADAPWNRRSPLPQPRYGMGISSVAGTVYLLGGQTSEEKELIPLGYSAQQDSWQRFDSPLSQAWSNMALVATDTRLYALGGQLGESSTNQTLAYQAIYTLFIPATR